MASDPDRHLDWEGVYNVRDLGGHVTGDGSVTRWGALVRADSPMRLSDAGWQSLREHGIATIVDLRDPEVETGVYDDRAHGIDVVRVSVVRLTDEEFWRPLHGERDALRFYRSALERWPEQFAAAVRAVAQARPGGVLVHCQVGRDRTGIVTALVLAAVGVPAEDIAADYGLSAARLEPLYERWRGRGEVGDAAARTQLALGNASGAGAMLQLLAELDVPAWLEEFGVTAEDVAALRARLLQPT